MLDLSFMNKGKQESKDRTFSTTLPQSLSKYDPGASHISTHISNNRDRFYAQFCCFPTDKSQHSCQPWAHIPIFWGQAGRTTGSYSIQPSQSKEKNGFLAVTLKWHDWKCQVVLLTDGIKIHSVLHEIQLLFALSKHGYFPAKVSAASAPGCEITCLILQVQRSLSVLPAIPRITFVCPGSLCTSSPCLPQSWLFSEWVTSVSVPGEAAPISMVPESPLSEFFPIPYPNHSEESNEFFHEVFS